MCTVLLPPGDNIIAINKYINNKNNPKQDTGTHTHDCIFVNTYHKEIAQSI